MRKPGKCCRVFLPPRRKATIRFCAPSSLSCEREGFIVVGADDVLGALLATRGVLGATAPNDEALADIKQASAVIAALGRLDVGQGAIVCAGLVLAVEAQEGTDNMITRVAAMRRAIRGAPDARRGVLVKTAQAAQERRIDLPVIGVRTIELASEAGLAGVAIETGGALIIDRDAVVERADALGMFVYGTRSGKLMSRRIFRRRAKRRGTRSAPN